MTHKESEIYEISNQFDKLMKLEEVENEPQLLKPTFKKPEKGLLKQANKGIKVGSTKVEEL